MSEKSIQELEMVDKIYQAIRKVYGYDKTGDNLVDFVYDLMDDHQRVERGA